jgi:hypothetical protein
LKAIASANSEVDGKCAVFGQQLQQLEYEARRAFEQYNEADARNRLVAAELERRWNQKLEELDRGKQAFERIASEGQTLTVEQERQLLEMGRDFKQLWQSDHCPRELKMKIVRTLIEEIVVHRTVPRFAHGAEFLGAADEGSEHHFGEDGKDSVRVVGERVQRA